MPMARHRRLMLAGVPAHVIQRGHNRAACFFGAADYRFYLKQLAVLAKETACAVHAYCLMTNHVHLLVTPATADCCSLLMKHLDQRYTQHVNRIHQRSGTLWDGRFHSCLVQSEEYLLRCYRYIELNPVRAGIVVHPSAYLWSSHRRNAGGDPTGLVTPHASYIALARNTRARARAYSELCEAQLDQAFIDRIRIATNRGFVLGMVQAQNGV